MGEAQSIQWFPGHMTKTKRQMEKTLKLVDAVAEIVDARIPISSRNPVIDQIIQQLFLLLCNILYYKPKKNCNQY